MEILSAKLPDNEIKYFTFGKGSKSFVMIPGLSLKSVMLSADAVKQAYSMFEDEYTVYVFDREANIGTNHTIEDMADNLAKAMGAIGISDAYVFGASQGGMIAQMLAIRHPQLVKKLVLGSTLSKINDMAKAVIGEWIDLAKKHETVALNHSIFTHVYSKEFIASVGEAIHDIEKDGTVEEMERFVKIASACNGFNAYDSLDKIHCPVLVLGAKGDQVLSGEESIKIAEKLNCEIYMYDGSHAVYDEAPDYKDRLLKFFAN